MQSYSHLHLKKNLTIMKTKIMIVLFCVTYGVLMSQVGINTANPQSLLHIDGLKDNNLTGIPTIVQQLNDFSITNSGNVGIGTTNPVIKLEINNGTVNGSVKIIDGTQGEGKVLTSDADGLATWRNSVVTTVTGITPSSSTPYGTTTDKYMNSYIDLPIGKWFVYLGYLVTGATGSNTNYASRLSLSSSQLTLQNIGFNFLNNNSLVLTQVSNGSAGAITYGMFSSGIIRVEVTAVNTRLYVWDSNSRGYGTVTGISIGSNGENYLFAARAN